jgi:hypothetical protein
MASRGQSKICVVVRKRPCGADDRDVVACTTPSLLVNEPKIKYDLTPYTERHSFTFDEVFDERSNNRDVYQRCAQPLIDTVFSRGNATCFAYGQTGSGKSFTMLGSASEPGLYMCAAHDVFARAHAQSCVVFASFYEIYGRKLFDLLNDRAKLVCREDGNSVIQVCGLTEHPVARLEELLRIIEAGNVYRAAGQTSANAESSRSHAVLLMEVREARDQKPVGRISFIDLAGNERGSDTFDSDRKTRMEGAEINKSLLALKECIRALGMGKSHVPFRGSILTEVLRDSFLGNSRTVMIATISPTAANCEHTLNTLRYTSRVKELGGGARAAAAGGGAPPQQQQAQAQQQAGANGNPPAGGNGSKAQQQQQQQVSAAQQRATALAERLALDAAAAAGAGGSAPVASGGASGLPPLAEPVPSRISNAKPGPLAGAAPAVAAGGAAAKGAGAAVKQGRRAGAPGAGAAIPATSGAPSGAQRRPAWDQNFSGSDVDAPALAPQGAGRGNANANGAVAGPWQAPLDPVVARIVQQHITDLDDIEAAAGADDSDSGEGGAGGGGAPSSQGGAPSSSAAADGDSAGLGSSLRNVRAVHAHIVSRIRASEESVLLLHRRHIDAKMGMMRSEVAHLQALDDSSGIDDYVEKVDALLAREAREIQDMRDRLARIGTYLKEEEVLSKTLTPAGKRQRPG